MKYKPAYLAILILVLLLTAGFFTLTFSQTDTPQTLTVTLNTPADGSTLPTFDFNFTYTPTLVGNNSLSGAKLIINGTDTVYQSSPQNATTNRIAYTFIANGTYLWNIKVQDNATNVALAAANFTVTVAVPPAPTPTPAPSPTPTQTPTPTPTPTATLSPTPTPTATPSPSPTPKPTAQPLVIDGWSILIAGLIVLAVIFALVIVLLWKAAHQAAI
jgi:hypothetical protein